MLPGTVQAWYEAPIYARVNGYLKKWNFDYGAHVKKGDVLAEIETPDLDAQLACLAGQAQFGARGREGQGSRRAIRAIDLSALARLAQGRRLRAGAGEQAGRLQQRQSASELGECRGRRDQGEVDRLQHHGQSFKNITVPFDGVVTARETDVGALINAGSGTGGGNGPELFRVADIHMMRIYVQVPQQLSADIKADLTADLQLPQYPNKTFKATVATTSSAINHECTDALVELHADNPDGAAAARCLCPGRFRTAERSRHRAHPDQRARLPRARDGGRRSSAQTIRSSFGRSSSGAISEPRSRWCKA